MSLKLPHEFTFLADHVLVCKPAARWYIYGYTSGGLVDISDGYATVLVDIPEEVADQIIEARDTFIDSLEQINEELKRAQQT